MFRDPFGKSLAESAGEVREGRRNIALSKNFFRIFSGKGLTERKANVLLEIFPLAGSGSLKFTLCD